jgi:hypothetical protein
MRLRRRRMTLRRMSLHQLYPLQQFAGATSSARSRTFGSGMDRCHLHQRWG